MSWVEEAAQGRNGTNGVKPDKAAASPPSATSPGFPSVPGGPVPAPPRICLARLVPYENPGISFQQPMTLCGQPLRLGVGDRLAFEAELVDCPQCREILLHAPAQGQTPAAAAAPAGSAPAERSQPARSTEPRVALPDFSHQELLEQILDVEFLQAKEKELLGELAAVRVFLGAARAKESAGTPE